MELDEIKNLLRHQLETGSQWQHTAELEAAIRKTTGSLAGKIKRNIWFEMAACFLCLVMALIVWPLYSSVYLHLFCIAVGICCLVFGLYLQMLYKRIVFYETATPSVKESLQQIIAIVTRFTVLYFRISIGLLPVIFVFGLISGYMDVSEQGLLQKFHWSKGIFFYGLTFIVWSAIIYFFSRWYIRKLYGNYLVQLQQQLKDIENG